MPRDATTLPPRVLLVEDDPVQASIMSRWLEADNGARVVHVDSGARAREAISASPGWDAIVSDVNLPSENGLEVLRFARSRFPHTPIVMVTADGGADFAVEALRSRANDYLIKPFERATLVTKVRGLIEDAARERARNRTSVLAIGAHPDDVEIGCGGILMDHAARGDRVTVLTLTSGEQGGTPGQRRRESERAAELMQAELRMHDLPDTRLSEGTETIAPIQAAIEEVAPTIVYTHTAQDRHQDHRAVHRATMVAARGVPDIYCYQSPSSTIEFRPNRFVVVENYVERKLEVLRAFGSQVEKRSYLSDEMIRATLAYWGRYADYRAVEPLEVVRSSR